MLLYLVAVTLMAGGIVFFLRHSADLLFPSRYHLALAEKQHAAIGQLITAGRYQCCLKEACSYCFGEQEREKRGKICNCLEKVVTAHAPCSECIGEILEGEGKPLLAEYFPRALAEKMNGHNLHFLQQLIKEKYPGHRTWQK